jgi:outer membrane lipoprotein-sorting protein
MKQKFDTIEDYKFIYEYHTSDGKKRLDVTYKYFFKKPKLIRMEVQTGKYAGTVLIYNQPIYQNKVRVKPGKRALPFFIPRFLVKKSYPVNHKWFTDLRGNGIHQSDWGWFIDEHLRIAQLQDNPYEIEYKGEETINGRETVIYMLISNIPEETMSVRKEIFWIDIENYILMKYIQYDSSENVIRKSHYKNIELDNNFKKEIFTRFKRK